MQKIFYIIVLILGALTDLNKDISFFYSFDNNPINIMYIFLLIYLLNNEKIKDKNNKVTLLTGMIIALLHLLGYGIYHYNSLDFLISSKGSFIRCILKFIYLTFIYKNIILILFNLLKNIKDSNKKIYSILNSSKKSFLIRMILFIIMYVSFFLNEYPGIFTTDSISELYDSVYRIDNLENWHPVFHIYIISIFTHISMLLTKRFTLGIVLYSIFQILFNAFTFSYIISFLDKEKINNKIKFITFIFFLMYPPFWAYSITMWKDIPFGLCFVYFIIEMIKTFTHENYLNDKKNIFRIIISSILFILFKNNGFYVVFLSFLIYTIFCKANRKKFLILLLFTVLFNSIYKGPVFKILNITDGPVKEALSVPIQQLSRTYVLKKDKLTKKERKIIKAYIQNKDIEKNYYPFISDNMKETFNAKLFKKNKKDFIYIYLKLFIKYPNIYFEQYFLGSMGYWYPEVNNYIIVNWFNYEEAKVIPYDKKPLIKIPIVDKIKTVVNDRKIPILSILFNT